MKIIEESPQLRSFEKMVKKNFFSSKALRTILLVSSIQISTSFIRFCGTVADTRILRVIPCAIAA